MLGASLNSQPDLSDSIRIGPVRLANRAFLAPLAGVSDVPFRRICREHGASLTYVEMLSATALVHGSRKTFDMLRRHPVESILGVQVTGHTAEVVAQACVILQREGFDTIDINMGCPVRKIVSAGCGSAILRDAKRIAGTLEACHAVLKVPLSAKIRLGFTREDVNVTQSAALIAKSGCTQITIHGRTRSESYAVPVDLPSIAQGFQSARACAPNGIVCVSNGDVFSRSDALEHLRTTGADAVMVSRGALGNPWVFRHILSNLSEAAEPSVEEWADVVLRHLSYHTQHYGDTNLGTLLMRKHLLWYAKGFPGAKALRERINQTQSLNDASELIRTFARTLPSDLRRFSPDGLDLGANSRSSNETESGAESAAATEQPNTAFDPKYEMDRLHDRGVGDDLVEGV
jgi:tRNA-dihydrouridine synthase B